MYTYICRMAPQKVTSHVSNSEFLALTHNTPRIIFSEKQKQQKELDGFGKESSSNLPTLAIALYVANVTTGQPSVNRG